MICRHMQMQTNRTNCLTHAVQMSTGSHNIKKCDQKQPKKYVYAAIHDLTGACVLQIAALFEFLGALLLGRVQTETIAGGIADINAFTRTPEIYAYGMVSLFFEPGDVCRMRHFGTEISAGYLYPKVYIVMNDSRDAH